MKSGLILEKSMRIRLDYPRISSVLTLTLMICVSAGALIGFSAGGFGSQALAHSYVKGKLVIQHPWGRPSPGDTKKGAVYLTIENKGKTDDTLVGARTEVSQRTELHSTLHENGVMKMRKVEGGVKIAAGKTVKFAPGGNHIMLLDMTRKIAVGEKFPLTLIFEKAGEVEVSVEVAKMAPGHAGGH
jgi:copper(I)-binding protein